MPLPAVVTDLATVPEPVRGMYRQEGTSYVLDVEGVDNHPAVSGLRRNRDELLDQRKKDADRFKAYEGLDPEAARAALAAQQKADEDRARKAGEFDQLREQMATKHREERERLESDLKSRDSVIDELVRENVATSAIAKAEGSTTLLLPHVLRQTRTVKDEATGKYIAVVVDEKGNERISDSSGKRMTIEELVAEMKGKDDYAGAFRGTGSAGGGAAGAGNKNGGSAGTGAVKSRKDLTSPKAHSEFIRVHGLPAYKALPDA